MKKGLVITLVSLITLVVVFAIFIIVNKNISNDSTELTMIIEEGTLTRTSAKIIIKGKDFICGEKEDYYLEVKDNDEWKSVKQLEPNFVTAVSYASKNNKLDFNLDWHKRYGELENGQYRIVKSVSTDEGTKQIYAEFTIE